MSKLIRNTRLIVLIILTLIFGGIVFFSRLPREISPDVDIPLVMISAIYPGANPADIEELVVKPIENKINEITGIDEMTSISRSNVGVITIQFSGGKDTQIALNEVKDKVDLVDLPETIEKPLVQKIDITKNPLIEVLLVGEYDRINLGKVAEKIKGELESSNQVSEVATYGLPEEKVLIKLNPGKLQEYELSPSLVLQLLKANDITFPSGEFEINDIEYQVSVDNSFKTIEDIRNQILNIKGATIPLSEIAEISIEVDGMTDLVWYKTKESDLRNGVQLQIFKSKSKSIDEAGDYILNTIKKYKEEYPEMDIIEVTNVKQDLDEQFQELYSNFYSTIFLVFFILFLFLGTRQAFLASISIPLTFFSSFIIMFFTGLTLNSLSLFSLLLALGMVVDDAIVIVSGYSMYSRSGKFNTLETGLMVFRDFVIPIWSTTITTVWAFVPLLFSSGIIGEYIKSIPAVVTATLLSSTTVAVFIVLPLVVIFSDLKIPKRLRNYAEFMIFFILGIFTIIFSLGGYISIIQNYGFAVVNMKLLILKIIFVLIVEVALIIIFFFRKKIYLKLKKDEKKVKKKNKIKSQNLKKLIEGVNNGFVDFRPIKDAYRNLLTKILENNYYQIGVIVFISVFILLSIYFLLSGNLKSEFFPKMKTEKIYVNLTAPSGWNQSKLQEDINESIEVAIQPIEIEDVTAIYGSKVDINGQNQNGSNYAYLMINLIDTKERKRSDEDILSEIENLISSVVDVEYELVETSDGGPPAGADIQVNILGSDLAELERLSLQFIEILENNSNAININTSLLNSPGELEIKFNQSELSRRGLTAYEIASWIRTVIAGAEVGGIGSGEDEMDVVLTMKDTRSIDEIENLILPGQLGGYNLSEVADIYLEYSPVQIERINRKRVVKVTAGASGISSTELYKDLKNIFDKIDIPVGYEWTTGGANEQNQESMDSILIQMQISFILILITVVLQLNSFRKALLVLFIIPLAVSGVFFNFTIFQIPLSFPSLIGVLALFGIVVNNSIMLMEKINQNHNIGLKFIDSIIDACTSRLDAITFTTITTVMGLLPITLSDPLWKGLGGAIIAGLSVSGLLILIVLPVIYKWIFYSDMK